MKSNVFLCHTEYHVLMSIFTSVGYFMSEEYRNYIYIIYNGSRLSPKANYNFSQTSNIFFVPIEQKDADSKELIIRISQDCNNELIIYNWVHKIETLIAFWNRKRDDGYKVCIGQEGLALYYKMEKGKWIDQIKLLYKTTIGFHKQKLRYGSFVKYCLLKKPSDVGRPLSDYQYLLRNGFYKKVYAAYPEKLKLGNIEKCKLPALNAEIIKIAAQFFNVQNCRPNFNRGDILFIDQPITDELVVDFLSLGKEEGQQRRVYIKRHPHTNDALMQKYNSIPNVRILDERYNYPVELLIMLLEDVNIVSSFSTALLIDNPKCKFFYLYPWQQQYGKLKNITIPDIADHIHLVNGKDELIRNLV